MKTKILSSFLLIALFLFSIAVVSAYSVSPTTVVLTKDINSATFDVDNTAGTAIVTLPATASITDGTNTLVLSTDDQSVAIAAKETITVSYSSTPTVFDTGAFSTIITADDGITQQSINLVYVHNFCKAGQIDEDDLELEVDIKNKGEGEDTEWLPRDTVEIEVDFNNDKDEDGAGDLEDIVLELGLYKKGSGKNAASDLVWSSKDDEKIKIGDIDEGDSESHVFEFKVPTDIDTGNYVLMIKAYSKDNEEITCIDSSADLSKTYYEDISIDRESDEDRYIIFESINLEPSSTTACNQEITLTAKLFNIGEDDQDVVKVLLINKDLGISLSQVIDGVDMDDNAKNVEFTFKVPENAAEKSYTLSLYARYDYDEDEDEDEEYLDSAFDEESSQQKVYLTVEGSCIGSLTGADVSVALSDKTPRAIIGKQAIVEVLVKNTGDTSATYTLSVSGVSSWAEATIDDSTFTLGAGESKTAEIVLDIDETAKAGDKEFTVKTSYGAESQEQKVLLELEEGGLFSGPLTGSAIATHIKDNGFIYTVIIVDLILIIAIIIAVRRMVRKP